MIPRKWQRRKLGDFVNIQSGHSPSQYKLQQSGKYPFVRVDDLNNCEKYQMQSRVYTDQKERNLVPPNSILFPKRGAAISTNKARLAARPLYIDTNLMALSVDSTQADPEFMYYLLVQEKLFRIADTSTVPQINNKHIEPYCVNLPPLPEQRQIAKILGIWDEAIALIDKRIEAARQRKKGLMQRLLTGRVRFPEFEGEEWQEAQLGGFFQEFTKRNRGNKDLTVLSCSTIHGIVPQTQVFSRRVASENTERYKVVERGDLVYDPMLLWDASIGFLEVVEQGVVSPAYSTFKFRRENGVREYFKYLIKMHYLTEHYKFISQGTNVRRRKAPIEAFLKLKVKVPSTMAEQRRIAAVLQTCDREIDLLEQKRDALQRQKKGLMQRLLTGRVRVSLPPSNSPQRGED